MLMAFSAGLMQGGVQLPPGGGSYDTVVAAIPGAVSFWRLQDTSTATLFDAIGGHHGSYVGSPILRIDDPWAEGASDGFCVDFHALGHGQVPHNAAFALAAGTLSLYFRCDSLSAAQTFVVTKDVSGFGAGHFTFRIFSDGRLQTYFQSANPNATINIESSAGAIASGSWYHYLCTFDGSGFAVYLDNILVGSSASYTGGLTGNSISWLFGRDPFANVNSDIALDEVVLFNRVVSAGERAALAGLEVYSFVPGDLPGGALWLESDSGVTTVSDGTNLRVSQWNDGLVGANNFTQATVAQRPYLLSNQLNGHPAIDFRGSELLVSTLSSQDIWPLNAGSEAEVWMVFAISSLPSSGQAHMFNINQNSTTNALQIRWLSSAFQIAYRNAAGTLSSIPTTNPAPNSYRLVRMRKDAVTVTGYLDGAQFGQITDARTHVLTGGVVTPLVIGGREDITSMIAGKVVFAWVGNQLLSVQETANLKEYITTKYGITVVDDQVTQATVIASAKNFDLANAQNTGISVTHGFTLQNNDVLYAFLAQGDDQGTGWASSSGGTWTQLANQATTAGDDMASGVLRRVVTNAAGEPAAYVFTRSNWDSLENLAVLVVQVRGANTTTPEDTTATTATGIDDFTPLGANITTTTDKCLILTYHYGKVSANKTAAGAPSGFQLVNSQQSNLVTFANFQEVARAIKSPAGTVTVGNWTGTPDDSTSEWHVITVAVRPAAVVTFARVGSIQTSVQSTRVASWSPITRNIGTGVGTGRLHVERIIWAGDDFVRATLNGVEGTVIRLSTSATLNDGVAIVTWNDTALPAAAGNYTLQVSTNTGGTVGHALGDTFQGASQFLFPSSRISLTNSASIAAGSIAPAIANSVYLDALRTDLNQSVSSKTPSGKAVDLHATGTGGFTNTFHGASLSVSASVTPGYTMDSTAAELELAAIIIQPANP